MIPLTKTSFERLQRDLETTIKDRDRLHHELDKTRWERDQLIEAALTKHSSHMLTLMAEEVKKVQSEREALRVQLRKLQTEFADYVRGGREKSSVWESFDEAATVTDAARRLLK